MTPIALLVPWSNYLTNENGWVWETDDEMTISEYATEQEALLKKPLGYRHYIIGRNGWIKV